MAEKQKKPKVAKVFPWHQEAQLQLRACIGSKDAKTLQAAMLNLLREVTPSVDAFISEKKFQSGKRVLSALRMLLVHFELRRNQVDKKSLSKSLLDLSSALLSIMLDLQLFLTGAQKKPLSQEEALSRIVADALLFTGDDDRHMLWDLLLQSSALRERRDRQLGAAILERLIPESPWDRIQSPEAYIKCLLCMRLWYQNANKEQRSEVLFKAQKVPVPKHLSKWLASNNLQGVPPYSRRDNLKAFIRPFLKTMNQEAADTLCTALSDEIVEDNAVENAEIEQTVGESKEDASSGETLFVIDKAGQRNPDDFSSELLLKQIEMDLENLPEMPVKQKKTKRKIKNSFLDSSELESLPESSVCENSMLDREDLTMVIAEEEYQNGNVEKCTLPKSSKKKFTGERLQKPPHTGKLTNFEESSDLFLSADDYDDDEMENKNGFCSVPKSAMNKSPSELDRFPVDDDDDMEDDNNTDYFSKPTTMSVNSKCKISSSVLDTDSDGSSADKKRRVFENIQGKSNKKSPKKLTPKFQEITKSSDKDLQCSSAEDDDLDSTIENLFFKKSPDEIAQRRGKTDTEDDLSLLTQTLPSIAVLDQNFTEDLSHQLVHSDVQKALFFSPKTCSIPTRKSSTSSPKKASSSSPQKSSSSFLKISSTPSPKKYSTSSPEKNLASTNLLERVSANNKISDVVDVLDDDDTCCSELERSGILKTQLREPSNSEKPDVLVEKDVYVTDVITQTDFSGDECSNLNNTLENLIPDHVVLYTSTEQNACPVNDDRYLCGSQQLFSSQTSSLKLEKADEDLSDEFLSPETTPHTTPENSMTSILFDCDKAEKGLKSVQDDIAKNLLSLKTSINKSPPKSFRYNSPKSTPVKTSSLHFGEEMGSSKGVSTPKHKSPYKTCSSEIKHSSARKVSASVTANDDNFCLNLENDCHTLGDDVCSKNLSSSFVEPKMSTPRSPRKAQSIVENTSNRIVLNDPVLKESNTSKKKEKRKQNVNDSTLNESSLSGVTRIISSPEANDKVMQISNEKFLLTPLSTRCDSDRLSPDSETTHAEKRVRSTREDEADDNELPSPMKRHLTIQKMKQCNSELETYIKSLGSSEETGNHEKLMLNEGNSILDKPKARTPASSFFRLQNENVSLVNPAESKRKIKEVKSRRRTSCSVELMKLKTPENIPLHYDSSDSDLSESFLDRSVKRLVKQSPSLRNTPKHSFSENEDQLFDFPKTYSRTKAKSGSGLMKTKPDSNLRTIQQNPSSNDTDSSVELEKLTRGNEFEPIKHPNTPTQSSKDNLNDNSLVDLSPRKQSAVQEKTYLIIDEFLKECRNNLHKKVKLDDTMKSVAHCSIERDLSLSQDGSSVDSQPRLTPTSDVSVQTLLQSRHIAMLTPNITRKRLKRTPRDAKSSSSKLFPSSTPVTRSCSARKKLRNKTSPKLRSTSKNVFKVDSPRAEKLKSEMPRKKQSSSDTSERVTRSQSSNQSTGYSFRTRPKTPGNGT